MHCVCAVPSVCRAVCCAVLCGCRHEVDELFSEWDKDGSGSIGLAELKAILKQPLREHRLKKSQQDKGKSGGGASGPSSPSTTVATVEKAKNVGKAAAGFKSLKKG